MKVTFDTNVADRPDLVGVARSCGFDVFITSVTSRELLPSEIRSMITDVVLEIGVLDESYFGEAVLGSDEDAVVFEEILSILSNGSFPPPGFREKLTNGATRQLRDAMIFCAHVNHSHEIFVTDDERGFIRDGRREKLERISRGKVMTSDEFLQEFGR